LLYLVVVIISSNKADINTAKAALNVRTSFEQSPERLRMSRKVFVACLPGNIPKTVGGKEEIDDKRITVPEMWEKCVI
jgi:hypothetical protein